MNPIDSKTNSNPRIHVGLIISFTMVFAIHSCIQEQDCPTLSDSYFPNETGHWWIYDRFDSLAMSRSSLRVEIIGDSIYHDGTVYKVWVYGKNNLQDTLFVRENADSVLFYRYLDGFPADVLILPLTAGKAWVHPLWVRDSSRVMPAESVSVSGEVFSNAYPIERRLFAFNDYLSETRWFVPKLGLVKLENWHYLFGWISKENWILESYSVR